MEETELLIDPLIRLRLVVSNRRLSDERKAAGYTLQEFARKAGVKHYRLALIGSLRATPLEDEKIKIAIALNKPIDYLFPETLSDATASGVFNQRQAELTESQTEYILQRCRSGLITDGGIQAVEDKVDAELLKGEVDNLLNTLKPREKRVVELRFGMIDGKSRTLEEVGKVFNLTGERARQIEGKALRKLRRPARAGQLKKYYQE